MIDILVIAGLVISALGVGFFSRWLYTSRTGAANTDAEQRHKESERPAPREHTSKLDAPGVVEDSDPRISRERRMRNERAADRALRHRESRRESRASNAADLRRELDETLASLTDDDFLDD